MSRYLTAEQKLIRARTQLLLNHPFFGTLCVRLKLVSGSVPTMATDGRRIVYNTKYVEELKPAELEGVLAHEVLHCALAHHCRRGQREPELWNEAADYAVNPILLANGVVLPAGVLVDPAFAELSAEEIYARLPKARKSGEPPDSGDKAPGAGASSCGSSASTPQSEPAQPQPPTPGRIGEVIDAAGEDGKTASQAERMCQERRMEHCCRAGDSQRQSMRA